MGLLDFLSKKPSRSKFADLFIRALRNVGVNDFRYIEEDFTIVFGKGNIFFLGNVYQDYCRAPLSHRKHVLQQSVGIATEAYSGKPENFDDIKDNLLPHVRERAYYPLVRDHLLLKGNKEFKQPIVRLLSDNLTVEVCLDTATSFSSTDPNLWDTWGIEFDEALKIAKENLWHQSNEEWTQLHRGVYLSPWQDAHDVSRLTLPTLINLLKVKGDPVAFLPSRDYLIVTGSDDAEGLQIAVKAAVDFYSQESRRMTGEAVCLRSNRWVPYLPPIDHRAYNAYHHFQLLSRNNDYSEQCKILKSLYEKQGKAQYPAIFEAIEKENGACSSSSFWAEGVEALIPSVEKIAFMKKGPNGLEHLGIAEWDNVTKVLGRIMYEQQDLFPTRYLVTSFPTSEQLEELDIKQS